MNTLESECVLILQARWLFTILGFVKTMSADTWTLSSYLASEIIPLVIHSFELNTDLFRYPLLKNKHPWKGLAQ